MPSRLCLSNLLLLEEASASLTKLESFGLDEKVIQCIRTYSTEETNRIQRAANDKYWAISFLFVSHQPPECRQCDYAAFDRQRQNSDPTITKRQLAELSLLLFLLLLLRRAPRALESGPSERQHLLGVGREDSEWG